LFRFESALTLSPMMCSWFLLRECGKKGRFCQESSNRKKVFWVDYELVGRQPSIASARLSSDHGAVRPSTILGPGRLPLPATPEGTRQPEEDQGPIRPFAGPRRAENNSNNRLFDFFLRCEALQSFLKLSRENRLGLFCPQDGLNGPKPVNRRHVAQAVD